MTDLTYYESFDVRQILAEYPLGDAFTQGLARIRREELRALQNRRFLKLVARAWQIPFYQRLWGARGLVPADIRSLDDIARLPTFGKQEVMDSVALAPPLGDFHGADQPINGHLWPVILHTTSGTTGRPQPLLFSPKSREIQSLLLARIYRMQGLQPREVVHSVYGHGMINGGHYVREAILHYTHALLITPGTGVETPSVKQVELMRDFGVNVVVGFADYIKRLADVAREQGITPGRDIPMRRICGHLGRESREALSQAWGGAEMYDWYGVGDTGAVAGEGPDHDGLYVSHSAGGWIDQCVVNALNLYQSCWREHHEKATHFPDPCPCIGRYAVGAGRPRPRLAGYRACAPNQAEAGLATRGACGCRQTHCA